MLYQADLLKMLEVGLRSTLPAWGLASDSKMRLLAISENATYLIEDSFGKKRVMRVQRPGYHTLAEIESELDWIRALRGAGSVSTPAPITTLDGRTLSYFGSGETIRYVAAFEWVAGNEPELGGELVAWYHVLGQTNASLHQHSKTWRRPVGFERKVWNFDTIIGESAHWGDWRHALGLTSDGREVLERTHALLRKQVESYGMTPERFGLVHCDLRLANLVVDGEQLTVIDFDDCGFSWFAYDFAACVSFLEEDPRIDEFLAAWLEGYRSVVAFSEEDERAIPMFLMLRRMQLTAWVASHSETPTAQAMGEDFTRGTVALAKRYSSYFGEDQQ
jgi:Ser/Thr protein kinase RdoA (MazF antagonist)